MKRPKRQRRAAAPQAHAGAHHHHRAAAAHHKHQGHAHPQAQAAQHHHHQAHAAKAAAKKPAAKKGAKKPRGLALGEGWACCSAEALAASLRLAGWPCGDADVLALHVAAGGSRDAGVTIEAALQAAAVHGLAGCRPRGFELLAASPVGDGFLVPLDLEAAGGFPGGEDCTVPVVGGAEPYPVGTTPGEHPLDGQAGLAGVPADAPFGDQLPGHEFPLGWACPGLPWSDLNGRGPDATSPCTGADATPGRTRFGLFGYAGKPGTSSLLLGLELPGPHAVTVDGPGLWTWGEWHPWSCFPGAVAEEVWAVAW